MSSPSQKPSGKMEFVPDSATARANRPTAAARSATKTIARRPADQSVKVATKRLKPQAETQFKAPLTRTLPPPVPEQVAEPDVESVVEVEQQPARVGKPARFAKKELADADFDPVAEPEALAQSQPDPPAEFSEMPEPSLPAFELPIVRAPQRPMRTDDAKIVVGDDVSATTAGPEVVNLFFEEESTAADDATENMDFAERKPSEAHEFVEPETRLEEVPQTFVESTPASEVESVAAEETSDQAKVTTAAVAQDEDVQRPSDEVLAELKPIRTVEIRRAVEIPALAEMDNPQLREPANQARAMLRKRPPFKFWPVYRDPWVASRDSFAFHHNPLWFEDPNLERCGRGHGHLTSAMSFVQFNANIAILPYRMTAQPSCSCTRTLPDCTVCQKFGYDAYLPPWSWRAAAVQAGAITGFIYAIP